MVCILLGNGFEQAEALVPADLLRRAGVEVVLTALEGSEVTSSHQVTLKTDRNIADIDPDAVELLFLPGGLGGVQALSSHPLVPQLIQQVNARGGYIAAICAAPTVLATFGLLEGKRAVCYPGMEPQMAGAVCQASVPVVVDGNLITGEAAGAAFPFGLRLVELLRGPEAAQKVRDAVHYHG